MNNIHMVEETLNRIQSYDGVIGVIVVNNDGLPKFVVHNQYNIDNNNVSF